MSRTRQHPTKSSGQALDMWKRENFAQSFEGLGLYFISESLGDKLGRLAGERKLSTLPTIPANRLRQNSKCGKVGGFPLAPDGLVPVPLFSPEISTGDGK
ncbi:hypothetical protein QA646_16630 [Rhizobium sp. CB3090]|uniref:hypothetical protein n=1 Tax=Rhizobium sp. CB3090 TaxID=3039156 RepID=UPI0024B05BCA|nr:hypothetical protein [Rhizobium sp. CB3090]WFU08896.1 hypothetical protein QA646_16630 [Rhizobium sp. CB3090]